MNAKFGLNCVSIVVLLVVWLRPSTAFSQSTPARTIWTTANGTWNTSTTSFWYDGTTNRLPNANDHVEIRHDVTVSADVTVKSISLNNASATTELDIAANADVVVTEASDYALSILGSASNDNQFYVRNGATFTASNNGGVLYDRTCNCSKSIKIQVDAGGVMDVGDMEAKYTTNSTTETTDEIQIYGTATFGSVHMKLDISNSFMFVMEVVDNGVLTIDGDLVLEPVNGGTDADIIFYVGNASTETATCTIKGNAELRLNSTSTNPDDIRLRVYGNSTLTVEGQLYFNHDSSDSGEDSDVEVYDGGVVTVGSIRMNSSLNASSRNNRIELNDNAALTVNGDVTFESYSTTDAGRRLANTIELLNSATLTLKGNVRNSSSAISTNEGRINPVATTSSIYIEGTIAQTLPDLYNGSVSSDNSSSYLGAYPNLYINNTSGSLVQLEDDVSIITQLSLLQGIVNSTSTNTFTFNSGATSNIGDYDAFIIGPVRKIGTTTLTMPLGAQDTGVDYWTPLGLSTYVSGAANSQFEVEYVSARHSDYADLGTGINHISWREHWLIKYISGTTPTSLKAEMYWKDACYSQIQDLTSGELLMARYDAAGTAQWTTTNLSVQSITGGAETCDSGDGDKEQGSISAVISSLSNLTAITFADPNGNNSLPVELLAFEVHCDGSEVIVNWSTATETNNRQFTIERGVEDSGDLHFTAVGEVPGRGTRTDAAFYQFEDYSAPVGRIYYRLAQFDFDGTVHYSPIKSVTVESVGFSASPNPTTGVLNLGRNMKYIRVVGPMGHQEILCDVEVIDFSTRMKGLYLLINDRGQQFRVVVE